MQFDQLLRQRHHVLGLASKQPDGLDVVTDLIFTQPDHFLWSAGNCKEPLGRPVDAFVRCLGRKYDCHEEGKVIDEIQFTLRFGIDSLKPAEQFFYFGRFEAACFGHEYPVHLQLQR